jgi:hypothetical protein
MLLAADWQLDRFYNGVNVAQAESHGGVLRTDKVFPGAKLEMKGVYKGNYAKFGNEVNVFFLYEGSRFSFNPTIVCS